MQDARHPKEKTQNYVDDRVLAGLGLQVNGQRRKEDRQDDKDGSAHRLSLESELIPIMRQARLQLLREDISNEYPTSNIEGFMLWSLGGSVFHEFRQ